MERVPLIGVSFGIMLDGVGKPELSWLVGVGGFPLGAGVSSIDLSVSGEDLLFDLGLSRT